MLKAEQAEEPNLDPCDCVVCTSPALSGTAHAILGGATGEGAAMHHSAAL